MLGKVEASVEWQTGRRDLKDFAPRLFQSSFDVELGIATQERTAALRRKTKTERNGLSCVHCLFVSH